MSITNFDQLLEAGVRLGAQKENGDLLWLLYFHGA